MIRATALGLLSYFLLNSSLLANDLPKVLLLNSYHPQYLWTQQLTKGVEDTLADTVPLENLHIKYLNARRFIDDEEHEMKQLKLMKYEFNHFKPDIIITFDDAAYQLLLKDKLNLFNDIPAVFGGVNIYDPIEKASRPNTTGIVEGQAIEENFLLIRRLHPQLNRIVVFGDRTGLGFHLLTQAEKIAAKLKQQAAFQPVTFDFRDLYHFPTLEAEFKVPRDNSAIFVLAIHKTLNQDYFSYEHELPKLNKFLNVPLYGMWGALMLGKGTVGGYMNDPYIHGSNVAKIALDILAGKNADDIAVVPNAMFKPQLDHIELKRFGVEPGRLPGDARVINVPESFFEKHKVVLQVFGGLCLVLFFVIATLSVNIRQRSQIQRDLKRFNKELEEKVKERTQELHKRNSQLEKAAAKMQQFAYEDSLTHLGNRRAAAEELTGLLKRHSYTKQALSIALVDIDFFKQVNDNYGHDAGDQVLIQIAILMKSVLRPLDGAFRWGGEEFLVTLPEATWENAAKVCERLRNAISEHPFDIPETITVSIGVSQMEAGDTLDGLITRADQLLYQAKANGRDQVIFV